MTEDARWVSCAQELDYETSRRRHLTHDMDSADWVTTLCGATGTPGSFRSESTKPPCPRCLNAADAIADSRRLAAARED